MNIAIASRADLADVLAVVEAAFGQPNEARLVAGLLADPTAAPALSLLAKDEGKAAGHILFTRVTVEGAATGAAILCPLAVHPDHQGKGIGGALVREGLERLGAAGTALVFVLGHPGYYPRFGFTPAGAQGLAAPYPIAPDHADAWMVANLGPDPLPQGRVACAEALDHREYWVE